MASIDSLEVLKAIAKQVRNATEVGENTAERVGRFLEGIVNWLKDQNFDERYLRKDIEDTAQQLIHFLNGIDVKGHAVFNDTLSSEDFISGFLSGKGWAIWLKDFINAAGVTEKLACMELDELTIRKTLKVFEFIISQMRGENDNVTFSGFMKVDHYDAETGRIYLKTDDGQLYNPFRVDDYLYCQQFNGMPSEKNDYTVIKTYEFIVTDAQVGSLEDNEKRLDWITLKNFAGDLSLIAENDVLVRLDNLSNPDRKGIIQLMTVGNATPYIDILYGTKTDPDNSLKGRLGNLQGIYHHLFGWLESFGAYLINLYAVGDFRLRRTGESLDSKIEMLAGLFATNFSKLTYEITEEDNYLKNASFTENLNGWLTDATDARFVSSNDAPFLMNGSLLIVSSKIASIEECEGRNRLHLKNASIRQLNSDIRKPGTHKVYVTSDTDTSDDYTEEPDKLYLSIKFLPVSSGTLTLGFIGASSDVGSLPFISKGIDRSNDWQTIQVSGTWDGVGDFILSYTGDMYVSLLSLTADPLSEFKSEVSTSIEQTATNIRLLGANINNVKGTVTQLGIDLDAANERISIYADKIDKVSDTVTNLGVRLDAAEENISIYASKTDKNTASISALTVNVDSISSTVTSVQTGLSEAKALANAAQSSADAAAADAADAYGEANAAWWKAYYAQEDADTANAKATSNASTISQHADYISILNGRFNSDGSLVNASGLVTTSEFNSLYSAHYTLEGEVAAKADISTSVQYDRSTGKITSDVKITADIVDINNGVMTIDRDSATIGDWHVKDGMMTASSGWQLVTVYDNYDISITTRGVCVSYADGGIESNFGVNTVSFEDWSAASALDVVNNRTPSHVGYRRMCAIHVKGCSNDLGLLIEGVGCTFRPSDGALFSVHGLSLAASAASGTAKSTMDFIRMTGNLTLPSAASYPGKIYLVKCNSSYTLTVPKCVDATKAMGDVTTSRTWKDNTARIFASLAGYWYEFYCG